MRDHRLLLFTHMSDPAPRKPMTPAERARHASLVRWGKEQPFAARLAAVREARKKRKGKAAPKGKKPKLTPEQQEAARAKVQSETLVKIGFEEDSAGALADLRAGNAIDDDGGLEKMGLAERDSDGNLRLTTEGRAVADAASRGDAGAARDAMSRGKDKAKAKANAGITGEEKEKDPAAAEEEKKPKGGGGGGGGKEKPTPEEKDAEKAEARKQKANATAATVGMAQDELDDLRLARDEGGISNPALVAAGLVGPDGLATDQGRRALTALENGNVGQYRAALQDAQGRLDREKQSEQRGADAEERRKARDVQIAERDADRKKRDQEREKKKRDQLDEAERRKSERRTLRIVETKAMDPVLIELNTQITRERFAQAAYTAMATWADANGFPGLEAWAKAAAADELAHATQQIAYLNDRDRAVLQALPEPPADFEGYSAVLGTALELEQRVTASLTALVRQARDAGDEATALFVSGFLPEQVKAEKELTTYLQRVARGAPLDLLDEELFAEAA